MKDDGLFAKKSHYKYALMCAKVIGVVNKTEKHLKKTSNLVSFH